MKNKGIIKSILPSLLSLIYIVAITLTLVLIYSTTQYLPFLLVALILSLLVAIITVVALLGISARERKPEKTKCEEGEKLKFSARAGFAARLTVWTIALVYNKIRKVAMLVLTIGAVCGVTVYFAMMLRRATSLFKLSFWQPVLLVVLFVLSVIFDKWCKHTETDSQRNAATLANARTVFYLLRVTFITVSVVSVISLLGFGDLQKYAIWIISAIFFYVAVLTLVSVVVLLIRRELFTSPRLIIPLPFANIGKRDTGVISFLEKNTGITMRGLWSMKLVKTVLPYTAILVFLLFWASTGLVQIEPYQQGAVYRFGRLSNETLEPGLHMTLPYPIDKVEIYDTESINKITVGYAAKEDSDNLWTGSHGTNEHKLLLGNGNELVSVNLRLEFKINDLTKYLRASSSPAAILEAKAYELITSKIIVADLEDLLAVDRAKFTEEYTAELREMLAGQDIGLELVSVVLESIHPPLEIAAIYQEVVGAEILAEAMIKQANSDANVTVTNAEAEKNASINAANAEYHNKVASATADVSEFNASVEAAAGNPDAYHYYKYLKAVSEAYGKARLVIVGEGVDSSKIYFGNLGIPLTE
ncbi:MAG: protease modulator HflK [Clostridia bacterium]|nr:protease modulator HflK [Clostridia bacterium]